MTTSAGTRTQATERVRPGRLAMIAVAVGVGGEVLLHNTLLHGAEFGAGFTVAGLSAVGVILGGRAWLGVAPGRSAKLLATLAGLFAVLVSWRAAPELAAANVAAVAGLLVGAAYLYRGRRLVEVSLPEYPMAGVRTLAGSVAGPPRFAAHRAPGLTHVGSRLHALRPVARGVALAAVPLIVFAVLFATADAVFADLLARPFDVEFSIGNVAAAVMFAAAFSWVALGALWYATTHDDYPEPDLSADERSRLGTTEAGILLGAVNLLFAGFVVVQFAYLFGGAGTVADVGGLTYAEYARQGFFQLLVVAGLVVGLVLAVDHVVNAGEHRSRLVDRLHLLLVGLTGVVLASAAVRLDAYVDEFGLTKLRFYAGAMLIWVALLLVWMTATVIRGRRSRFPAGAVLSALLIVAALNVANPDARIAQVNLDRQLAGGRQLDIGYVTGNLSADAVPVLVESLETLPVCERARLANALVHNGEETGGGWRSFNLGRSGGRHVLTTIDGNAPVDGC